MAILFLSENSLVWLGLIIGGYGGVGPQFRRIYQLYNSFIIDQEKNNSFIIMAYIDKEYTIYYIIIEIIIIKIYRRIFLE